MIGENRSASGGIASINDCNLRRGGGCRLSSLRQLAVAVVVFVLGTFKNKSPTMIVRHEVAGK